MPPFWSKTKFKSSAIGISLVISLLSFSTTIKAAELTNPKTWKSNQLTNHPLVGKIWSREKNSFISAAELTAKLKTKTFILLGEIHDNPDHHWLQAEIIKTIAKGPEKPSLVIEMIRVDQMPRFESYIKQENSTAKNLGQALQWEKNGWPKWEMYLPIGEQIFTHKLEVYPGLPSRMTTNNLIKSNLSILPPKARETFKIDIPFEDALEKALVNDVRVSHCNKLPERVLQPMANVQRFRDAWMADVMIHAFKDKENKEQKHQANPVILIAGSGHVRDDRGVPWFLKKRASDYQKDAKSISIQFTETTKKAKTIKDLAHLTPNGDLAADYIWVTPTLQRGNPCDNIPDFGKK